MRKLAGLLLFIAFNTHSIAQDCEALVSDTMSVPGTTLQLEGGYLETTLKKQAVVRIFKTEDDRLFLRFIVTENFYFNQISTLEIQSGTKSYYVKNCRQHKVDKAHGMYITEIYRNYLATIKEYGITGLVFGGAESNFTRQDAAQVKAIAQCVYNSLPHQNSKK